MGLLYTKMKIFHFKDKIESLPQSVKKILPPIQIRIKPTNVCAHKCWYCAYRAENLQLGKDMKQTDHIPKRKMMEIIEDIVETVKKLSQTPVKFASLTHGARLQGEVAEIFAHYGTWLRISIDGWDDES